MTMKFRCHQDPLYYDPKSNDKIFVPTMHEVSIKIILSTIMGGFRST